MSALSDTLDRVLKELRNPIPVATVTPKHSEILQRTSLYFQDRSSDKEYHIDIVPMQGFGYVVNVRYGRRGHNLIAETKTTQPVSHTEAVRIFNKVRREKLAKGYRES